MQFDVFANVIQLTHDESLFNKMIKLFIQDDSWEKLQVNLSKLQTTFGVGNTVKAGVTINI